jgi:hypothetical protein
LSPSRAFEPLGVDCRANTHIEVWTAGPLQKDRGRGLLPPLPLIELSSRVVDRAEGSVEEFDKVPWKT